MRQEANNEMDLLLRRLSRRQGVPASDADFRAGSDHLDADELNSYAENVLPAAARTRYTEHLADCSRCRELVVQLSSSVPVVAAKETVKAAEASGLRKFLASLFSPMVLRYAVPALGLIIAAAIGVMVLRSNRPGSFVADVKRSPQPVTTAQPYEQPQAPASSSGTQALKDSSSPLATREIRRGSSEVPPPAPPNAAPVVGSVRVEPKSDTAGQTAPEQAAANAAAPAQPPPKPAAAADEMRVEIEGRKATSQARVGAGTEAAREKYDVARTEVKKAEEAAPTPAPAKPQTSDLRAMGSAAPASGAGSSTRRMRDAQEKEKDRQDGETRSVAGRRFRNQGGVWVDTAYDAGSATMNIARGSEQYRALIADEPDIKAIVDQLGGPVIVVWKGRAYRIR